MIHSPPLELRFNFLMLQFLILNFYIFAFVTNFFPIIPKDFDYFPSFIQVIPNIFIVLQIFFMTYHSYLMYFIH